MDGSNALTDLASSMFYVFPKLYYLSRSQCGRGDLYQHKNTIRNDGGHLEIFIITLLTPLVLHAPLGKYWPRLCALKPGLIRLFFFIRNSVFLSQIHAAFLQTTQIPPEFRQANMPIINKLFLEELFYFAPNNFLQPRKTMAFGLFFMALWQMLKSRKVSIFKSHAFFL